jgi:beta-glucosidase
MHFKNFLLLIAFITAIPGFSQKLLPYKNPALPVETRVNDLLGRMTVEEKFFQLFMIPGDLDKATPEQYKNGLFGFQVSAASQGGNAAQQMMNYNATEDGLALAKKINQIQKYFVEKTRLGIPIIAFDEGLHGLVRGGATSFPQSIGLAASFDTILMRQVAHAIALETKTRGIRQILSPVINIASDVRWGRVEETYGEDPFLTSEMGVAYVSPFEKMNIITTPKHLIANVGDGGRDSYPIAWNERFLEEIHFPPFWACFSRGGTRSLMSCYNSLDGTPCTMNDWLLNQKLKKEFGFKGFVVSDAGAVGGANVLHYTSPDYPTSSRQAIEAGLDVIFQTAYEHYPLFIPPFLDGSLDRKKLDEAVVRVLRAKFELGLFENPYVSENDLKKLINPVNHKNIARKAAQESIVLLKNEKNTLPLSKKLKSVAVIGIDATEARLGGYSGPGNGKVSILDGIKQKLGNGVQVSFAAGCGRTTEEFTVIPEKYLTDEQGKTGLTGNYFNNITLTGNPILTRKDEKVHFNWTLYSADKSVNLDFYSVRWTGKLQAPATGNFKIGLEGNDGFRLFVDGRILIDNWKKQSYHQSVKTFYFEKGKKYDLRIEFYEPVGNAHIKLIWNAETNNDWESKIKEAVTTAQNADAVIVAAGIYEGEFLDRAMLSLPGHQEEMIKQIAATGKPVVVVLVGGSAITMTRWMNEVNGIIDVWYPGEEGGYAVADVLFGDYNPAGRLPVTFPIDESQLPLVYNHKPTGRGDDYNNLTGLPLYPFGYGLSYTQFEYSNLHLSKNNIAASDSSEVSFVVTNVGEKEGDEVVQLYIRDLLASVSRPVLELKGFARVHLKAGEAKEVTFKITPELLKMLNAEMKWVVEPGEFRIMIGASSRDLRLKETLTVK